MRICFLKSRLDQSQDRESEQVTVEAIREGIEFKGSTIWILIFAIFIASLGLNTNSTAVIIGAMLISPLMGPIMGIGLGLGINDFELIKKSFRNLGVATIFSVLTSTLYFLISPLNEARSELLARTSPTIYDVLIALFGGLAGIVAMATKQKGNVIMYGRFRPGQWKYALFFRSVLSVLYQFCFYCFCNDNGSKGNEVF